MNDDDPSVSGPEPQTEQPSVETTASEDGTLEEEPPAGQSAVGQSAVGQPSRPAGDICKNCGKSLVGEYCHRCGQRDLPQPRLRDLGRHFLEAVLDIDDLGAGLRRTLIEGLRSPGALARQYVDGRRKQVAGPISYFLVATTFAFVVYGLFRAEWIQGQAQLMRTQWEAVGLRPAELFSEGSPFRDRYGWTSASDLAGALFSVIQQIQTYLTVLVCLIAAGTLRGLFSEPTYADLVVFELYTVAQVNVLQALLAPVLQAWSPAAIFAVGPVLLVGLHIYSGPGFFGSGWKGWVAPPLAIVAALLGQVLIALVGGLIWRFIFL